MHHQSYLSSCFFCDSLGNLLTFSRKKQCEENKTHTHKVYQKLKKKFVKERKKLYQRVDILGDTDTGDVQHFGSDKHCVDGPDDDQCRKTGSSPTLSREVNRAPSLLPSFRPLVSAHCQGKKMLQCLLVLVQGELLMR